MRLLHTKHLVFQEFFEDAMPPYAILSHRWGMLSEEVSYEDFVAKHKTGGPGYQKITAFCEWAEKRQFQWVWIDTCCIDKRSSAEVSEAINSMFAWYGRSQQCGVYLADIEHVESDFTKSDWFNRGWTLQELLAPTNVVFLSSQWETIGTKDDPNVAARVSRRTGVPARVLKDPKTIHYVSVARRMSWAANRRTTKPEDAAYSLLGIFDINMPLLYGEGSKAFRRLQLHIMEQCEDESIFAWREESSKADSAYRGLLATSPHQFADCGNVVVITSDGELYRPVRANARTVEFWTRLLKIPSRDNNDFVEIFQLRCAQSDGTGSYLDLSVTEKAMAQELVSPCFIVLKRRSKGDPFSRVKVHQHPWKTVAYREWQELLRQPEQAVYGRTAFSVDSVFNIAYGGKNESQKRKTKSSPTRNTTQRLGGSRSIEASYFSWDQYVSASQEYYSSKPNRHQYASASQEGHDTSDSSAGSDFEESDPTETACGFPCARFICTTNGGRRMAQQLQLTGSAWHNHMDMLVRDSQLFALDGRRGPSNELKTPESAWQDLMSRLDKSRPQGYVPYGPSLALKKDGRIN